MVEKGDLIELKNGSKAIVTSGVYTHRKMEAYDYEMESHGMGDLAGIYCSAFNVVFPETGNAQRIICGDTIFKKISNAEELS